MSRLSIAGVGLSVLAMGAYMLGAPLIVPPAVALAGFALGAVGHRRTLAREEERRRRERLAAAATVFGNERPPQARR